MEAVALVLAGGLISLVVQHFTRDWAKKDKADERYQASLDKHRDDVQQALAEFMSASGIFLDRAFLLFGSETFLDRANQAGHSDRKLLDQAMQDREAYFTARTAAEVKAFKLVTMIKDAVVSAEARAIVIDKMPAVAEFPAEIAKRRDRLRALIENLAGVFVPELRPSGDEDEPRQLEASNRAGKLLP